MNRSILFLLILCYSSIVFANEHQNSSMAQFKTYLSKLDSVIIDFTQTAEDGSDVKGKLLIKKPYKFRCNYELPFPMVIIGNKNYVAVYDYDMETVSLIKPKENIFNFLLTNQTDFEKYFLIESAITENNILTVKLYHAASENFSIIVFNKTNNRIEIIKTFDDNGNEIVLKFDAIRKVARFAEELFEFKNPDIFGTPPRLTGNDIEKNILY